MKKRIFTVVIVIFLVVALFFAVQPRESSTEDMSIKAYNFFLEKGFSSNQAISIVALIHQASNFDPTASSHDGNFYGLCQWGYIRLELLKSFADSKGKDVSDFETQLEFIASELSPDSSNYQLCKYNGFYPKDWEKADNIADCVTALFWTFYRPQPSPVQDSYISQQIEWAESFQTKVAQSQKDIPQIGMSFNFIILFFYLLLFYLIISFQILLLYQSLLINILQVP